MSSFMERFKNKRSTIKSDGTLEAGSKGKDKNRSKQGNRTRKTVQTRVSSRDERRGPSRDDLRKRSYVTQHTKTQQPQPQPVPASPRVRAAAHASASRQGAGTPKRSAIIRQQDFRVHDEGTTMLDDDIEDTQPSPMLKDKKEKNNKKTRSKKNKQQKKRPTLKDFDRMDHFGHGFKLDVSPTWHKPTPAQVPSPARGPVGRVGRPSNHHDFAGIATERGEGCQVGHDEDNTPDDDLTWSGDQQRVIPQLRPEVDPRLHEQEVRQSRNDWRSGGEQRGYSRGRGDGYDHDGFGSRGYSRDSGYMYDSYDDQNANADRGGRGDYDDYSDYSYGGGGYGGHSPEGSGRSAVGGTKLRRDSDDRQSPRRDKMKRHHQPDQLQPGRSRGPMSRERGRVSQQRSKGGGVRQKANSILTRSERRKDKSPVKDERVLRNEARAKAKGDEKSKLYFSKKTHRKVTYKPNTKIIKTRKLQGLGKLQPDLNREDLVLKRANAARMKEFSKRLRSVNQHVDATLKQNRPRNKKTQPKKLTKAQKRKQYAAHVPKPKVAPKPKVDKHKTTDELDSEEDGPTLSLLEQLELEHQALADGVERIRREHM